MVIWHNFVKTWATYWSNHLVTLAPFKQDTRKNGPKWARDTFLEKKRFFNWSRIFWIPSTHFDLLRFFEDLRNLFESPQHSQTWKCYFFLESSFGSKFLVGQRFFQLSLSEGNHRKSSASVLASSIRVPQIGIKGPKFMAVLWVETYGQCYKHVRA